VENAGHEKYASALQGLGETFVTPLYHQPSTRIWNEIEKKAAFNLEFQAISDAEDQSRALLRC